MLKSFYFDHSTYNWFNLYFFTHTIYKIIYTISVVRRGVGLIVGECRKQWAKSPSVEGTLAIEWYEIK